MASSEKVLFDVSAVEKVVRRKVYDLPPTNEPAATLRGKDSCDEDSAAEKLCVVGVRASKGTSSPSAVYTFHTAVKLLLDERYPSRRTLDPALN